MVTEPADVRPGSLLPRIDFRRFLQEERRRRSLPIRNVKDLSENTVIFTGIGIFWSMSLVFALKAFAELHDIHPTLAQCRTDGGDGLASPTGTCRLIWPIDFLCHSVPLWRIAVATFETEAGVSGSSRVSGKSAQPSRTYCALIRYRRDDRASYPASPPELV